MICTSSDGLSALRKEMMVVDTNDEGANDVIASILLRAGPYVQSYKKHTKTAKDLLLGPMYNCAALQFETFAMSVQCCFDLSGLLQRSVMPLVRRKRKPGRRWRTRAKGLSWSRMVRLVSEPVSLAYFLLELHARAGSLSQQPNA